MLLRHVARPLLAAPFVYDGLSAALRPAPHVEAASAAADEVAALVPAAPRLPRSRIALLVRAHGALTAVAGLALALHKAPRTSGVVLAALTAPLVLANEPFTGRGAKRADRVGPFVRSLGLVGAALLAAADTEGRPGLRWRVDAARERRGAVKGAVKEARAEASGAE